MDEKQPHGSRERRISRQCTARSKRSGERCKKPAMRGRTVCRSHGGATPRGIASTNFRHGRWSKDLPAQLASRYEEARHDPELLSLRDEIALVDAQISTVLSGADVEATRIALARLVEQRRRLAESEAKHLVLTGQMLDLNEAMTFAAALAETVRRHINDPAVLDAIQRDIAGLLEKVGPPSRTQH